MHGSTWLDAMQAFDPNFLHAAWDDVFARGKLRARDHFSAAGDDATAAFLAPYAALMGCNRLTGEMVGKARLRHGLHKFRSPRTNGTKPDVAPAPEVGTGILADPRDREQVLAASRGPEQQLPLEAAGPTPAPDKLTVIASHLESLLAELRTAEGTR